MTISIKGIVKISTFTPTSISGLQLWLDASDYSTLYQNSNGTTPAASDGDPVGYWADKSGNGRHVSQSSGTNKPTLSSTGFNSKPTLTFSGSHSLQRSESITSGDYSGVLHFFYVAARTTADGGTIYDERSTSKSCCFQVYKLGVYYISSNGADGSTNHQINQSDYDLVYTSGAVISHKHISGSRDVFRINGTDITVTYGTASNINGTADLLRIGGRTNPNLIQMWTGKICEVLAFTSTLSASDVSKIENYLGNKWRVF